jgi:hypothetical protein
MLWLFDCQRAFVHDVLALKSVNDVVALVTYALMAKTIATHFPEPKGCPRGFQGSRIQGFKRFLT